MRTHFLTSYFLYFVNTCVLTHAVFQVIIYLWLDGRVKGFALPLSERKQAVNTQAIYHVNQKLILYRIFSAFFVCLHTELGLIFADPLLAFLIV